MQELPIGKGRCLKEGKDICVLTIGPIGNTAAQAIEMAEEEARKEGKELSIAHYDMRFLKPIDQDILHHAGSNFQRIITIEDGVRNGGLGSAVLEFMAENNYKPQVIRLGLPDDFVEHGTVAELQHLTGIDKESIKTSLLSPL